MIWCTAHMPQHQFLFPHRRVLNSCRVARIEMKLPAPRVGEAKSAEILFEPLHKPITEPEKGDGRYGIEDSCGTNR